MSDVAPEQPEATAAETSPEVAATAAASEASAAPAAPVATPTPTPEPDLDALLERVLKDPSQAGKFGRRLERRMRSQIDEGIAARLAAEAQQRQQELQRQRLEDMDPEDFKQFVLENQRLQQLQSQGWQQGVYETHQQWVSRLQRNVPANVLEDLKDQAKDEDDYLDRLQEYRVNARLQAELEKQKEQLLAEARAEWEEQRRANEREATPRPPVATGVPVGAGRTDRTFSTMDEVHAAHVAGEITANDVRNWMRRGLPYQYDLSGG